MATDEILPFSFMTGKRDFPNSAFFENRDFRKIANSQFHVSKHEIEILFDGVVALAVKGGGDPSPQKLTIKISYSLDSGRESNKKKSLNKTIFV